MFNKLKGNSSSPAAPDSSSSSYTPPAEPAKSRSQGTPVPGVLTNAQKPAIVAEPFTIRGDIDSDGTLHVEGRIIGMVKAQTIHVSATGRIEGEVTCDSLTVKGQVDGRIQCQELNIASTARVSGHVAYRYISVSSGARLDCEAVIQAPQ